VTISVTSLFTAETAEQVLAFGLDIARLVGLPVTSWRSGDPTRSLYKYLATKLALLEGVYSEYIKAGFLSSASGDWLTVLALEVYGVTRTEATYAAGTITLTNSGGGFYAIDPGDLTFKCSATDKTFHNTTSGTLSAGATVVFSFEADEAGSASSVALDEIDELVTTLLGVTITTSSAAVANDEQDDVALKVQCQSTLGALSPDGPPDAYEYVVRNPELTGVTEITRAATAHDSTAGTVTVYVASPTGTVTSPSVAAAQDAVEIWATPLCITPTVVSVTTVAVNVTATISGDDIPLDFEDLITTALGAFFSDVPVDGSGVAVSRLIKLIHDTIPEITSVTITIPAANVALAIGQAPITGTVSITVV
jgi:baseplate J-like protein